MAKYIWIIRFACEVFYCWNKSSLWNHIVLLSQISFATLFCSLASRICPLYLPHFIFLIPVLFTLPDAVSLMFSFLSSGYYVLHVKQSFFSPHSVTVFQTIAVTVFYDDQVPSSASRSPFRLAPESFPQALIVFGSFLDCKI